MTAELKATLCVIGFVAIVCGFIIYPEKMALLAGVSAIGVILVTCWFALREFFRD